MRLAILLAASVACFGQLTPSSLSFTQRQNGTTPYFQDIVVTGTGAVTIGACANTAGSVLCLALQTNATALAGTVHVFFDGYNNFVFAPGVYQATFPVTRAGGACAISCTATINFTVVAYTVPTFQSPIGPTGCTTSGFPYLDTELCQPTNMRPGGTFNMPATIGASITDPNFGGTVTRISNPAEQVSICSDSTTSVWNSDQSLVCIQRITDGTLYFVTPTTGTVRFTNPPSRSMSWSTVSPNVYYYLPANCVCIHKVTLNLTTYTITSDVNLWDSGATGDCSNGGDGGVTWGDGYWTCFGENGNSTLVYLVNLQTATAYTSDYAILNTMQFGGQSQPRLVTVFNGPSSSGKLWLILGSYQGGTNEFYSLHPGGSSLTDEGPQPIAPYSPNNGSPVFKVQPTSKTDCLTGFCYYAQHMTPVTVGGRQYLNFPAGPIYPAYSEQVFIDPDLGLTLNFVSVEAGGAMTESFPIGRGDDTHTTCSMSYPVCLTEVDSDPIPTAYYVTNVNTGATTTVTSLPPYSGFNGDVLLIGGVLGVTGMSTPTLCTVAGLAGSNFTCSGLVTSGTYTANSGSFTKNVTPVNTPHQFELLFFDATNIASKQFTITRLASHRNVDYSDRLGGGYYGQSHPNCPISATICAFESNGGIPDSYGVYTILTGYSPSTMSLGSGVGGVGKVGGNAIIH